MLSSAILQVPQANGGSSQPVQLRRALSCQSLSWAAAGLCKALMWFPGPSSFKSHGSCNNAAS